MLGRNRHSKTKAPIVFLACPYGQIGGGMGSIMSYLAAFGTDLSGQFRLVRLETRGGGHIIFSPFYLLYAIARIVIEAIRGRLAIVHINLADGTSVYRKAMMLFASRLTGTKVLLHFHAGRLIPMYDSMGAPGKMLLRAMVHHADHCVVLGKQWYHWLIETLGARPDTISVVYNGVPATALPRRPRAGGAPFQFLFIGNLLPNKGVTDLLQAFALPELRNSPLTLTLAGGGAVEQYEAMAAQLHIAERVRFTGWVSQATVRALLTEADALVLPSYVEGLPLVILEAIASRVPVICTPVGTIPELFEDGTTALFVAPGDLAGLAKAMLTLSRDTGLQGRLSEAGFTLYQEKFSMSTFREQIGSIYSELAHKDTAIEMPDQPGSKTGFVHL
jgi:glycosyltransferase involved in cell wall biosynthesis